MKLSLNWLKDYLKLDNMSNEELYEAISLHISEIETMTKLVEANNLMIGYVKEKVAHPDSDHLNVCQVELKDGISQIVCGAPNVDAGQKVIVALPGAVLPGDFKIKPAKVRGVESNGMICSLQELGIDEKYVPLEFKDGIYVLDIDAPVGGNPLEYLGFDDTIIDLDLTSNRSDLLSVLGVAYDLGAYLGQKVVEKEALVPSVRMMNPVKIDILTDDCYEYRAHLIKNVKIADSPRFIKARLIASGIRPINNIVDITNYVLMELGQPLHAYDHAKLGDNIVVRNALEKEKITTLDGTERELCSTDVVITDGKNPVCLGGVMGGLDSEVTNETVDIVLEAAMFNPLAVRKASSRLGLKSESSTRFERKVNQARLAMALDYAAMLIHKYCGGMVVGCAAVNVKKPIVDKIVEISTTKINSVLGTELSTEKISEIFTNLAYEYKLDGEKFTIKLPHRRTDLEESCQDIIEDVARMLGYDNIPTTVRATNANGGLTKKQKDIRVIKQTLASLGLNETVTYSLVSQENLNKYNISEEEPIKLLMPLTSDRALMRQSLINGLVDVIKYNRARQIEDINIFEVGKVYNTNEEHLVLAGALTGIYNSSLWQGFKQKVDFYLVKGLIVELARRLNKELKFEAYTDIKDTYHPGRSAKIYYKDQCVGILAAFHPEFLVNEDLPETYVFELNLDLLLKDEGSFKYETISKFPSISRDIAIVLKKEVKAEEVLNVIRMVGKKYLVDVNIFDLYMGANVASDEKSLAIKMVFNDKQKTLGSDDVDKLVHSILNRLDFYFKARLR